jgi:hypothetical protein
VAITLLDNLLYITNKNTSMVATINILCKCVINLNLPLTAVYIEARISRVNFNIAIPQLVDHINILAA